MEEAPEAVQVPVAVENAERNINVIGEHCLTRIFSTLPIQDRFATSLVCKNWYYILKELGWANVTCWKVCQHFIERPNLTVNTVLQTLEKSIKYLTSCCISIEHHPIINTRNNPKWKKKVFSILSKGEKLRSVIWDFEVPSNTLERFFEKVINQLEELVFLPSNKIDMVLFAPIFRKGSTLKTIIWEMNPKDFNARHLTIFMEALPRTITHMHIQMPDVYFIESILTNIDRFDNLDELHIIGNEVKLNQPIYFARPTKLSVLQISKINIKTSLSFLSGVCGLKKLILFGGRITKEIAQNFIIKNREIEEIDIENIVGFNDDILDKFLNLRFLKKLSISHQSEIRGTNLRRCDNLKKLCLYSCPSLTEESMANLLGHARCMRLLILIENDISITENMIQICRGVQREERFCLYILRNNGQIQVHFFPKLQPGEYVDLTDEYDEIHEMLQRIENGEEDLQFLRQMFGDIIREQTRIQNQVQNHREEEQ
ncbi:hypothetical protein TKK_0009715 [Trichogramma kaykai]|uniref:F-box domain-containing protein n=1 Tax=Trichogramma kaykai TaxID=54128 RepID=A0ABD2X0K2_9HYME